MEWAGALVEGEGESWWRGLVLESGERGRAGGEGWCLARWRGVGLMEWAGARVEGEGESWWRGLVLESGERGRAG